MFCTNAFLRCFIRNRHKNVRLDVIAQNQGAFVHSRFIEPTLLYVKTLIKFMIGGLLLLGGILWKKCSLAFSSLATSLTSLWCALDLLVNKWLFA